MQNQSPCASIIVNLETHNIGFLTNSEDRDQMWQFYQGLQEFSIFYNLDALSLHFQRTQVLEYLES